jgi:hypothetical protein
MSVHEILEICTRLSVFLSPHPDGSLKVYGPRSVVTPQFLEAVKANKSILIQALSIVEAFEGKIVLEPGETLH